MKRENYNNDNLIEDENIDNFMKEILDICKKYNLSISHEDCGGCFLIEEYGKTNIQWLNAAYINIKEK